MKKNWLNTVFLALVLLTLSGLISMARDQVFGQQVLPGGAVPQVLVRPPAEAPKMPVDYTWIDDPATPGRKYLVITIVDPETKRIVVYHEDMLGQVKWKSTRNIQPDLIVDQYNAVQPTPRELEENLRQLHNQHYGSTY